jgi:hypothetical protein
VYKYTDTTGNGAWSLTRDLSAAGAGTSVAYSSENQDISATIFTGAPTALPTNNVYILPETYSTNQVLAYSTNGRDWSSIDNSSKNLFQLSNNSNQALTVAARKPLPNIGGDIHSTTRTYSEATSSAATPIFDIWTNTDLALTVPSTGVWLIEGSIDFSGNVGTYVQGTGLAFSPLPINYTSLFQNKTDSGDIIQVSATLRLSENTRVFLQYNTNGSSTIYNRSLSITNL